jgi:hypothetical protein
VVVVDGAVVVVAASVVVVAGCVVVVVVVSPLEPLQEASASASTARMVLLGIR